MPDAGPSYDEDGGQRRPDDQARFAGQVHRAGHGSARPVREYRKSRADRVGNAIFSVLARVGIGPSHLLTTRGRMTGRLRTTPVILVMQGQQRWLVAPYGAVPWLLNARAAGQIRLRRGHDRHDYTLRQLPPAETGPILQRYIRSSAGVFFVIPLLAVLLPASISDHLAQYLPSNAGSVIWGGAALVPNALSPWTGFALLCGYAVVLVGAGAWRLRRSDA